MLENIKYHSRILPQSICKRLGRRGGKPHSMWDYNWIDCTLRPSTVTQIITRSLYTPPCCIKCCKYSAKTFKQAKEQIELNIFYDSFINSSQSQSNNNNDMIQSNILLNTPTSASIPTATTVSTSKIRNIPYNLQMTTNTIYDISLLKSTINSNDDITHSMRCIHRCTDVVTVTIIPPSNPLVFAPTVSLPRRIAICCNCGNPCDILKDDNGDTITWLPMKSKHRRRNYRSSFYYPCRFNHYLNNNSNQYC